MISSKEGSFEKVAWCYDALSFLVFGRSIRKSQVFHFGLLPKQASILVIGGGTGWIINELFEKTNPAELTYIELSPNMLRISKKKTQEKYHAFTDFILGDETCIPEDKKFDVVITNFFLDLFHEKGVDDIVRRLQSCLSGDGLWIYTDFVQTESHGILYKIFVKAMFLFFRFFCRIQAKALPPVAKVFESHGMQVLARQFFYFKYIQALILKKHSCN